MQELIRKRYLDKIRPFFHDHGMIKVITGIRRCGKSVLMKQIANELYMHGIDHKNIVFLDLDDPMNSKIRTADQLNELIDNSLTSTDGQRYLFIDEVQNVTGFETVINGYRNVGVSVFITGSNSYLLSTELTTKLTGRYLEFKVLPFTFKEVEDCRKLNGLKTDVKKDFDEYLVFGGLPKRLEYPDQWTQKKYVDSVIDEAISRDILLRRRVNDRNLLNKFIHFISSIPGGTISSTSVAKFLKQESINIKPSTVNRYLDLIFASNISYKCERFDVIGKKTMKTLYKSFLADTSMHTLYSGKRDKLDYGMLIENVVYLELKSRGYEVFVGKKGPYEIDFVVFDGFKKAYVQVAYSVLDVEVCKREEKPLMLLNDKYQKYLITMDSIKIDCGDVTVLHLIDDFLLGDGFELG